MVAEKFDGKGNQFLMVVRGDLQMGGAMDVVLRHICTETAGVGKHGDRLTHGALLLELARALGGKVGYGFLYFTETVEPLSGKASAGADGLLVGKFIDGDAALTSQFFPSTDTHHGQLPAYPALGFLHEYGK